MIELPISGPTPFPNVPSTLWARIGQQCEHFLARLVQQQQKWHEQTSRSHTINTYSYYHNYHHHFLWIPPNFTYCTHGSSSFPGLKFPFGGIPHLQAHPNERYPLHLQLSDFLIYNSQLTCNSQTSLATHRISHNSHSLHTPGMTWEKWCGVGQQQAMQRQELRAMPHPIWKVTEGVQTQEREDLESKMVERKKETHSFIITIFWGITFRILRVDASKNLVGGLTPSKNKNQTQQHLLGPNIRWLP